MADLYGPELPRSSAAVAEPTAHDPDAKGHFGVYGGRFVPEALMAVIEEVTAAYEKARGDQTFLDELDRLAEKFIRNHGATPAYKGYRGFPATICVAPNNVICHGFPDKTPLREGDIVGIDIGAITPEEIAISIVAELIARRRNSPTPLPHMKSVKAVEMLKQP